MKLSLTVMVTLCVVFIQPVVIASPSTSAEDVTMANTLKLQGEHYKAMFYYQSALSKDENNIDALNALAKTDYQSQNFESALKRLNKTLIIDGYNAEALLLRAKVYSELKQWEQALADLEMAEQLDSENPEIQLVLDRVHLTMGDKSKAKQSVQTYERLNELKKENELR